MMRKIARVSDAALAATAAAILFSMMVYTFLDVLGRYFFNLPLPGGFELTELMMAILIFAGLPLVTARRGHVTIDVFDNVWPSWFRRVQHVVVSLICAVVAATLSWRIWVRAQDAAEFHDVTAILRVPLAPFIWFMAGMMAVSTLIFLLQAFRLEQNPTENRGE